MRFILLAVFMVYFANYGVLYLLSPMKISLPVVSNYFEGIYPDFY